MYTSTSTRQPQAAPPGQDEPFSSRWAVLLAVRRDPCRRRWKAGYLSTLSSCWCFCTLPQWLHHTHYFAKLCIEIPHTNGLQFYCLYVIAAISGQRKRAFFRAHTICLASKSANDSTTHAVFILAEPYLAATAESGNIFRNNLPLWSEQASGRLCRICTPSNTWFLESAWVLNPNGISIGSAGSAGLATVTDQQTLNATRSATIGRTYIVLWCGLIIIGHWHWLTF